MRATVHDLSIGINHLDVVIKSLILEWAKQNHSRSLDDLVFIIGGENHNLTRRIARILSRQGGYECSFIGKMNSINLYVVYI